MVHSKPVLNAIGAAFVVSACGGSEPPAEPCQPVTVAIQGAILDPDPSCSIRSYDKETPFIGVARPDQAAQNCFTLRPTSGHIENGQGQKAPVSVSGVAGVFKTTVPTGVSTDGQYVKGALEAVSVLNFTAPAGNGPLVEEVKTRDLIDAEVIPRSAVDPTAPTPTRLPTSSETLTVQAGPLFASGTFEYKDQTLINPGVPGFSGANITGTVCMAPAAFKKIYEPS